MGLWCLPFALFVIRSTTEPDCRGGHVKITHRTGHDQVGLGVEVAAENVVAVALQRLQTLALQTGERKTAREECIRKYTGTTTQAPQCTFPFDV